jgi:hypothetical protein
MAMAGGTRAVLDAVQRRLDADPERVLPTLQLLADPDALAADADEETIALARTLNHHRVVATLRELRARSLSTAEVAQLLGGVSRQAVSLRVSNGRLMAIEISGRSYFPDWQFGPAGVLGGLPRVIAELTAAGHNTFTADGLMRAPLAEEGERNPADLLADGDVERVLHYVRAAGF